MEFLDVFAIVITIFAALFVILWYVILPAIGIFIITGWILMFLKWLVTEDKKNY